jgi:ribosome-binding protein aMBF1 (putative translation factor)
MGIQLLAFHQRRIQVPRSHISANRKPRKPFPGTLKTLGDRIQAGRFEEGLLQSELAEKLGVTTLLVRRWEENLETPCEAQWPSLSNLLNLTQGPCSINPTAE